MTSDNVSFECYSCKSLSGERPLSPGAAVHDGKYWVVEHVYPTALIGWLVIVLKRHARAPHELTEEEFKEFGVLVGRTTKLLYTVLGCETEYVMCFAEKENFHHVHFHIVPRDQNLSDELKGGNIFTKLNVSLEESFSSEDIRSFCEDIREQF